MAQTPQTGALAFSTVGLYLVATAISTTDEDLLLEHTTRIAQLGVQVPVVFSFAIAPLVFVALHVFTLAVAMPTCIRISHRAAGARAVLAAASPEQHAGRPPSVDPAPGCQH